MNMDNTMRLTLAAIGFVAAAAGGCEPTIAYTPPTPVVTAVFDPTTASIPLPNALALPPITDPNSTCPGYTGPAGQPPVCAQAELLTAFNGNFPSDQSLPITIEFTEQTVNADGSVTTTAPKLDVTSFTPSTFFIWASTEGGVGEIQTDPLTDASYVAGSDSGTLTIQNHNNQPWEPGNYAVLVRGGDDGIKTTDGLAVFPSQIFALIAAGKDLTNPANNGLLKAQLGSEAAAQAQGMQLNELIGIYKAFAFPAADMRFPHEDLAITTTFSIAPLITNVTIDPARGLVPLPIDLLRDPTTGKLSALAACTLAGSSLAADGTCPSSAAAGFEALDGFSTTGAILAPTSELINVSTITASTLLLFDLTDPANPVQVDASSLILEPCEFTSACNSPTALSPVIAIQPAGATAGDPTSVFRTKPLKDATDYAVVITTGVQDKAGKDIGPGTVAKVLQFTNPLVDAMGNSQLSGIDNTTAQSLDKMRKQLIPVFATAGIPANQIAIGYTFHTQTVLSQGAELAALPYTTPAATALPSTNLTIETPVAAFTKYGVDQSRVPLANIGQVLEVDITTFNAIDPATGAFLADPTQAAPETIHVLITTPKAGNANVPACTGEAAGLSPLKCSPLMIYRHGLGRGRADMLTLADSFAAAGMTTAAIDADLFGDRSACTPGGPGQCAGGGACTTTLPAGAQGDANPPGTCAAGVAFTTHPVSPTCTGACATNATDGIANVSGNYYVSSNFFRTRDVSRQDLIDQSQLIRALAFAPSASVSTTSVFGQMAGTLGFVIDPTTIYYSGQSLGSIQGASNVATNPRISKAGLNVGGGTIVDVFTNSPAFQSNVDALLAGLGIEPGTSQFLQFLVVAKTVLDPADPINYVGHLTANELPNLLVDPTGATPQAPKKILTQNAYCDQTVPNPFNFIYASNIPTGPLPTGAAFFTPGATGTFQLYVSATFNPATFPTCADGVVEHGFITDWETPQLTQNAQNDMANFVMHDTLPVSLQTPAP